MKDAPEAYEQDLLAVLRRVAPAVPDPAGIERLLRHLCEWSAQRPDLRYAPNRANKHPRVAFRHPRYDIVWKAHAADRKDRPKLVFLDRSKDAGARARFVDALKAHPRPLVDTSKPILSVRLDRTFDAADADAMIRAFEAVLDSSGAPSPAAAP